VPERILNNQDLELMVDTSDDWILSRTGIRERRICGPDQATSDLALSAAEQALKESGIEASDLDLILVATVTPDMVFPSTACLLQARLGASNAAAFDISAGCTGFVYALAVADRFLKTGDYRYVLVVAAETLSRITDYTDRNTCVLFGDGAGAMVLGRGTGPSGILSTYLGADGTGESLLYVPAGGSRIPTSQQTVSEHLHYIRMQGNEVFRFAVTTIPECVRRVLEPAGVSINEVDHFIFHQANLRILQTAAKRMRIPWDKMLINIERYGNMSAACIPLAVAEAVDDNMIQPGQLLLMVAFGAGLTMGSTLVRWGR
jgi:3-oxoacyl-[acyl-carrier-protein] synthase-3